MYIETHVPLTGELYVAPELAVNLSQSHSPRYQ